MRHFAPVEVSARQRGFSLLILVAILAMGTIFALVAGLNKSAGALARARDQKTYAALAQAREALIADAVADNNRPGSLPCPDTNNDGLTEAYSGNECPGYVAASNVYIGRLPWKSLGLPDLRDSSGERLWYAVSRDWAKNPSCLPNCPLTSDTVGELTVTGIAPVSNAVAIVFAPGAVLGVQPRDAANQNTASNYLEDENANGNNATFTTQASSTSFNDQLLTITNDEVMPQVEQRVAREMIGYLNDYRAAIGVYPWGDLGDGNSNGVQYNNAYNRNRFPCNTASPTDWGSSGAPALPGWLTNGCLAGAPVSGWGAIVYYAVAKNRLQNSGAGCTTCTLSSLNVTNSTNSVAIQCTTASPPVCTPTKVTSGNADLLLITPGGYTGSPARNWSQSAWTTISGYFDDPNATVGTENSDNNDDNFRVPSTTGSNRVRMFIVR